MWLEECGLKPEAAYHFDKKCDPDNLVYLALERSHIARYKRACHECIGQKATLELKWDDGRGFKTSKHGKKDGNPARYFHKQAQKEHKTEQVNAKSEASTLLPSLAEKGVESSDKEVTEFLSLQALAPEIEEEEGPGLLTVERHITEQTGQYNKLLLEDPHNVRLWIEFIAFQDRAALWGNTPVSGSMMGEGPQDTTGKSEKRRQQMALIERKIAIYEKALEKNPINVELLTGHMFLCQEVWERERVARRWKDLVFRQPQCAKLWLGYIQYCQTHYSSFSTSSLIATYTKALSTLNSILEGTMVSHKPEDDTEEAMLAIFANLCSFLQQSGHTEKALACFQALVEFNFYSPDSLTNTDIKHKQKLEFFETFWDSGTPRFGEREAVGWNSWFQSETNVQGTKLPQKLGFFEDVSRLVPCWLEEEEEADVREETEKELTMLRGRTLHNGWVELEQFREKEHFLPWHAEEGPPGVEPLEPDDPDRIVLFDDVASILFRLSKGNTRVSLLAMFLHFLGAPLPPTLVAVMFPQWLSMQLHNQVQVLAPQIFAQELLSHNAAIFASELYYHSFSVGASIQPLTGLGKIPQKSLQFIHSVFNQALPLLPQNCTSLFASMWLTLEYFQVLPDVVSLWMSDHKKMPKQLKQAIKACDRFAKGLLQHDVFRDSTAVWCTYATLKAMCGDHESAVKVVEVVTLQLGQGGTTADGPEGLLACKTYVEIVLGVVSPNELSKDNAATNSCRKTVPPTQEDVLKAKHCLICLADGQFESFSPDKVTSTLLLKGERKLQDKCQRQLSELKASIGAATLQLNGFTLLASCLAWLVYLNAGLDSACDVLSQVEDSLVDGTELQHAHEIEPFDRPMPTGATRKVNQEGVHLAAPLKAALESVVALRVRLIRFFTLHHPTPPSRLRLALTEGILQFPGNAHFLWQFATHETQSFLVRRVRRHFDSHVQQAQTAIPWLVAIAFEERRRKILQSHTPSPTGLVGVELEELLTGVVNRMRSLYQRATQHPSGRNCPLLWRAYMNFEVCSRCTLNDPMYPYSL